MAAQPPSVSAAATIAVVFLIVVIFTMPPGLPLWMQIFAEFGRRLYAGLRQTLIVNGHRRSRLPFPQVRRSSCS